MQSDVTTICDENQWKSMYMPPSGEVQNSLNAEFDNCQTIISRLRKWTYSPTVYLMRTRIRFYIHIYIHTWRYMDRVKRIWYLSPMRAAKVQASLRIRAVSPEPPLLAHTSSESRGTFRQKARSLAPLNSSACAVKICHDGMLQDTNSLDGAHIYGQ